MDWLGLASVLFFAVSGGPYGLESLVTSVGPGWAVVLVLTVPLVWALPIALMVAELSTMMPEEGGYYAWVTRALGPFWGVQEGWWSLCSIAFDIALYPVLFVDYLAFFIPALALGPDGHAAASVLVARWAVAAGVVGTALMVNLAGAEAVGENALVALLWLIVPVTVLVAAAFAHHGAAAAAWTRVMGGLRESGDSHLLAVGLATVLWNYSGWDNIGTFAGEVASPQRSYPRAIGVMLPFIAAIYVLPLLAGIAMTVDPSAWSESAGWPTLARLAGGVALGALVAVMALVSAWSQFSSQLLSVSRVPYAMARDGWLPFALTRRSARGVPTTAVVASCLVAGVLAALTFANLVVLDVFLYAASLLLEFAALIALRHRAPELARPFRVPDWWLGFVILAPTLCTMFVFWMTVRDVMAAPVQTVVVVAALASGVALYYVRRRGAMLAQVLR